MKILIIQMELNWLGVMVMASIFAFCVYGLISAGKALERKMWLNKLGHDLKRMELL